MVCQRPKSGQERKVRITEICTVPKRCRPTGTSSPISSLAFDSPHWRWLVLFALSRAHKLLKLHFQVVLELLRRLPIHPARALAIHLLPRLDQNSGVSRLTSAAPSRSTAQLAYTTASAQRANGRRGAELAEGAGERVITWRRACLGPHRPPLHRMRRLRGRPTMRLRQHRRRRRNWNLRRRIRRSKCSSRV